MTQPHHSVLLHTSDLTKALLERMVLPALMILCIFLFGTVGFLIVGDGRWNLFDCAYMTSITLTTVGYGEMLDNMGSGGRLFCMVLMWTGMGVTLYAVSTITGFVVEQNLSRLLRERKMEKRIAALKNHYIVFGDGSPVSKFEGVGPSGRPCVMIELKPERIE